MHSGGDMEVADLMNKTCQSACLDAALKPGDRVKINAFGLKMRQTQNTQIGQHSRTKTCPTESQPDQGHPEIVFPDAPKGPTQ